MVQGQLSCLFYLLKELLLLKRGQQRAMLLVGLRLPMAIVVLMLLLSPKVTPLINLLICSSVLLVLLVGVVVVEMGTSLAHLVCWDLLLKVILLIGSLCCELRTLLDEAMHCSSLVESICRSNFRIWERSVVTTEILFTSKIRSLHFSLHLLCLASCLESNENLTRP